MYVSKIILDIDNIKIINPKNDELVFSSLFGTDMIEGEGVQIFHEIYDEILPYIPHDKNGKVLIELKVEETLPVHQFLRKLEDRLGMELIISLDFLENLKK